MGVAFSYERDTPVNLPRVKSHKRGAPLHHEKSLQACLWFSGELNRSLSRDAKCGIGVRRATMRVSKKAPKHQRLLLRGHSYRGDRRRVSGDSLVVSFLLFLSLFPSLSLSRSRSLSLVPSPCKVTQTASAWNQKLGEQEHCVWGPSPTLSRPLSFSRSLSLALSRLLSLSFSLSLSRPLFPFSLSRPLSFSFTFPPISLPLLLPLLFSRRVKSPILLLRGACPLTL